MEAIEHTHSLFRWIILILLILTVVTHFSGKKGNSEYQANHKKMALFTLICAHLQLILGLVLYIARNRYLIDGDTMGNSIARFWSLEHIAGMLIAIILITIGYSKAKKLVESSKKYGTIFTYYLIALILILVSIPWPFRKGFETIGWI